MDHYKHITIDERETIFLMRNHGNSLREIASHIKKSYSTISRELSRNSTGKSYFTFEGSGEVQTAQRQLWQSLSFE
nr:helix-turn-helix domain-containing protein [Lentilactobacillus parafarraginis]